MVGVTGRPLAAGLADEIARLPKAELHCHLDGILDPEMVREQRREDPDFPLDPDALAALYPIQGVQAFFEWFEQAFKIESRLEYLGALARAHIARLKAQNVRYFELMAPARGFGLTRSVSEALERLSRFREWVDEWAGDDLRVAFTVGVSRDKPPELVAQWADILLALYEAGLIVGVGIAGPEQGYPIRPFTKTLARLHEAGMGIEVHAGEWCGPESVWDALEYGYPNRIGHGVALFQDPRLIELFQERRIHVEMCPTSNLITGSVARIEDHPIGRARELGLNFSINTDDPGAFTCSMNSEYELLARTFGFTTQDFMRVYENTLAAGFVHLL